MLTCGLTLLILLGEGGALYLWRQRHFPRPAWTALFGGWTWPIFAALLLAGLVLSWAGSYGLALFDPSAADTRPLVSAGIVVALLAVLVAVGATLFFRWVLGSDIKDIPD